MMCLQAGVAGALSQLTLGSSSQVSAVDEHLRRQGWEAGNIDYLGADAFDNIWAKIAQTLSSPTTSEPALEVAPEVAPVVPIVAQEPAPVVAQKTAPVVAAEPTPAAPIIKPIAVEEPLIDVPKETAAPPSSIESSIASTISSGSSASSSSTASSAASVVSTDKDPQGLYTFINIWLVVAMFVSLK